jgi:hemin uptake protein HemP
MPTLTMSDPPLHSDQPPLDEAESVQPPPAARESWRSEELLGERTEVLIVQGSEVYRLRRTRQDKLILYK